MKTLEAKPKDFLRKANCQLKNKRKRKKEKKNTYRLEANMQVIMQEDFDMAESLRL